MIGPQAEKRGIRVSFAAPQAAYSVHYLRRLTAVRDVTLTYAYDIGLSHTALQMRHFVIRHV